MAQSPRSSLPGYGVAVVSVVLATLLTLFVPYLAERTVFILYFVAVTVTAWYAGRGPAWLTIALSAVASAYFVLPPTHSFAIGLLGVVNLGFFIFVALLITTLTDARQRAEASARRNERWLSTTLRSIGDAVIATDADGRVVFMNKVAQELTGWTEADARGQSLSAVFHIIEEQTRAECESPVARVLREGGVVGLANHTILIARDGTERVIEDSAAPIRDATDATAGVVLVFRDATEQRRQARAVAESTEQLELALDAAHMGTWQWDIQTGALVWTGVLEQLHGLQPGTFDGKYETFINLIHPDDRARVLDLIQQTVANNGIYETEFRVVWPDGSHHWIAGKGRVHTDDSGRAVSMLGLALDLTARKEAEHAQARLAAIVESSQDAIIGKTLDGIITSWNTGAAELYGYTPAEVVGQPISVLIPADRPDELPQIMEKLRRGEAIAHFETVRQRKDGRRLNVSLTISPIRDHAGRIIGASTIARDITGRKLLEGKLREQAEVVETINRVGQLLSAELELENLVQSVTDAATDLTGAQFGSFFYNLIDARGASYTLYTLSGVPRAAFAHFPMPRATDLFGPTFRGEGTVRIDDVKDDPRYGKNSPYYGMPEGHLPVTSYLAVPVMSRAGEVLGGLFFGHSEAGRFTERHERLVEGLAAQTAIAMDNARLFEAVQKARDQAESANRMKDEFLADRLARTAHAAHGHLGMGARPADRRLERADFAAFDRGDRAQRTRAGATGRRPARHLAHRHGPAQSRRARD